MSDAQDRQEYLSHFPGKKQGKALEKAHDIRKFEIDLFWRRGAYFWALIAVAFAGYFALKTKNPNDFLDLYTVSALGYLFSLCWYLVNRGSAAWQKNWENHVDLLEDEITGPLYKQVIDRKVYSLIKLIEPYPFSPSKINNFLSLVVTITWFLIIVRTVHDGKFLKPNTICVGAWYLAIPLLMAGLALWLGTTSESGELKQTHFRIRRYR